MAAARSCAVGLLLALLHAADAPCPGEAERRHLVEETLRSLLTLGPRLPDECLQDAVNFKISFRPKMVRKLSSYKQAMKLSSQLLAEDVSLVQWDPSKLRSLQELLGRQTKFFTDCQKNKALKQAKRKKMEKYFQELRDFLTKESHRPCAWELVRAEMEQLFTTLRKSHFNSSVKDKQSKKLKQI
ncbi:interferon beta-like [Arapaima gigas]